MAIQIKNVMYDAVRCWTVTENGELYARIVEEPRAVIELRDKAGNPLYRIQADDTDSARSRAVREMKSRAITCVMAVKLAEFRNGNPFAPQKRVAKPDPELR